MYGQIVRAAAYIIYFICYFVAVECSLIGADFLSAALGSARAFRFDGSCGGGGGIVASSVRRNSFGCNCPLKCPSPSRVRRLVHHQRLCCKVSVGTRGHNTYEQADNSRGGYDGAASKFVVFVRE